MRMENLGSELRPEVKFRWKNRGNLRKSHIRAGKAREKFLEMRNTPNH
jgi:hypothetical protein